MTELIESFELCNIWRIRNPTRKRFTFRQKHILGYMQRRLDYFLSLISYKNQQKILINRSLSYNFYSKSILL